MAKGHKPFNPSAKSVSELADMLARLEVEFHTVRQQAVMVKAELVNRAASWLESSISEAPAPKRGRPKGSKNAAAPKKGKKKASASVVSEAKAAMSEVLTHVPASGKGKNAGDIAELVGTGTDVVSKALANLKKEGKVQRSEEKGARGGRYGDYVKA